MRRPKRTRSVRSRERSDRKKQWLINRIMKPMDKKLQAPPRSKSNAQPISQLKPPETRLQRARLPPPRKTSKRTSSRPPRPQIPQKLATESNHVRSQTRATTRHKRWSTRRRSPMLQSRLTPPPRRLQSNQSLSLTRAPTPRQPLKKLRRNPPRRSANLPSQSAIRTTLKSQRRLPPEQMLVKVRKKCHRTYSRLSPRLRI